MKGNYIILDKALIDSYRNTGGFDMLGSGRDKIEKADEFAVCSNNTRTLLIYCWYQRCDNYKCSSIKFRNLI